MNSTDKAKSGNIPYNLISIFIMLLIGIGVAGYTYYGTQKAHIIKAQQEEFLAIADLKVKQIINWRKERLGDATLIHDSQLIASPLILYLQHRKTSQRGPEILAWMKSLQRHYGYKNILLVDAKGVVVLATASKEMQLGAYLERKSREALQSKKIIFTDLHKDPESDHTSLDLIVPLLIDGQGITPAGTLILRIDPGQFIYPLIQAWPTPSESAVTLLVRREGGEIIYLSEPRRKKDTATTIRPPLSASALHSTLLNSGKEGIVVGNDYRGVPVIAALRAIPDSPWYLIVKVNKDEIYAPIRERARLVAGFIGFLVVASGVGVGLWWWGRNRQMDNLLRTSEARYRSLFEDSPISLWEEDFSEVRQCIDNQRVQGVIDYKSYLNEHPEKVADCLKQLKIIDVNQATLKLFKAGTKERLLENPAAIICMESIDAYRKELISIAHGDTQFHGETVLQSLMGDRLNVLVSLSVPPGYEESWEKVIVSVIDITERKRSEEALRLSEERLRATIENTPNVAVQWYDEQGRVQFWNRASERIFGWKAEDALGKTLAQLIQTPEEEALFRELLQQIKQSGETVGPSEYHFRRRDGREGVCLSTTFAIPFEEGTSSFVCIDVDITERKQADVEIRQLLAQVRQDAAELEKHVADRTAQLKAANEQLESFAYSVSHDLKAPLRGIDGYSRLLQEDYAPQLDDEGRLFVTTIRDSARQMTQLIDDLLAYSRLERRNMAASTIRFPAFADAVLSPLLSQMESCRVTVNVSLQPAEIRADADALGMALRNLVDNAIKFTRNSSEPVIDINGEATETAYILRVRDNGIGFDIQYRERIFEIFQRLQRSEEYPGTGIGLALVRKAMERMGGRVWAESIPGEGATFYLEVPQ